MRTGLALVLMVLLAACSRPDDDTRIRGHIADMTAALSGADARAFMAPLAEDFSAETWDLDRRAVQLLLIREFRAHERIRARVFDIDVELFEDDRASAQFQAVVTGGRGLLPEQGAWYRVTTGWRRAGNDWELISARWEQIAGRQ
ncbi:MAG: hypothetical protein ACXIUM_08850 [Wenzhouxiangella sp.]